MRPGILYQQSAAFYSAWTTHYDQSVEFHVSLNTPGYIDRILLTISSDTALTAVILSVDGQITDRYAAESHAVIREHTLSLTAGIPVPRYSMPIHRAVRNWQVSCRLLSSAR